MPSFRVRTKIVSEMLRLPELKLLVGKTVEIEVTEQPESEATAASIFDLFGKATYLRTGEDIAEQLALERGAWRDS